MNYKQKTARSIIPNSFLPIFFTPYALQAFATQDDAKCFYQALCHFGSFGSATCLIADKILGVIATVKHFKPVPSGKLFSHTFKLTPYQLTTFNPQFNVSWYHGGRPYIKRAGKVKSLVNRPRSFQCLVAWKYFTIVRKIIQYYQQERRR